MTTDELRTLFLFEALTDEQLRWIAERGEVRTFDREGTVYREGDPAAAFYVLLSGTIELARTIDGDPLVLNTTDFRGSYAGATRAYVDDAELVYPHTLRALTPASLFRLPAADFAELMHRWFPLAVHLLDGLYLGVRASEVQVQRREHLADLGALSANLAHELNNPAAATVRSTELLRERVARLRHKFADVLSRGVAPETMTELVAMQERAIVHAHEPRKALSPVEQSDREDALVEHLDRLGVADGYDFAEVFVSAGLDEHWLDKVCAAAGDQSIDKALGWLATTLEIESLLDEMEDASTRISTMVEAVKLYSHMDESSHQRIDLLPGIDATVVMLGHKLGTITVRREYDDDPPQVPVYAAELNQVWTNLIDNAADAMPAGGTLTLRTSHDDTTATVEVVDTGRGIPADVQPRIFDPFVTTKPPGTGSGLGLDNARRIVEQRHGGTLTFDTGPGGTTFRVTLPLVTPRPEGAPAPVEID
jgi:signal transduction histidine kinase